MRDRFNIAGYEVHRTNSPFIIAEMSCNHNGSLDKALELIELASQVGAHAIKFQTYTPDTMTICSDKQDFQISGGLWDGYSLYQLYQEAQTPWKWHPQLFAKAKECGILAFSSPFDENAVDFLEQFDPPAYKIPSFEANDVRLIQKVVATGKPTIVSTGLLSSDEVSEVVDLVRKAGGDMLALMHCVSAYPTPIEASNTSTVADMLERFSIPIGLSDHTLGTAAVLSSVAMGGSLVEKHFIKNRNDGGFDAAFSMEPHEFAAMCTDIKNVHAAIGNVCYCSGSHGEDSLKFRRSLYVVEDIKKGASFSKRNIRVIRPGYGLAPKYYDEVIGKKAIENIARGTPLSWELIA